MTRLITITLSHFCEKARWALDRARIEYTEERHHPGFHVRGALKHAPKPYVPILVMKDRTLTDSTDILKWVDATTESKLYPTPEALELEEDFDERLGRAARIWAWRGLLSDKTTFLRYALKHNAPFRENVALIALYPAARKLIGKDVGIENDRYSRARATLDETFAEVSKRLSDGRRYLTGDRLTAADITFAALCGPVLLPEQYAVKLPGPEVLPKAQREDHARWSATPAGQFALRLYREER